MAAATKPNRTTEKFDLEYDVIVVGYGYAGGISAINAADHGARVLLIEKSAVPGGISICSYGALRCANDRELAFQYLKETNGGRTPDDVIRALADGMCEMEGYVRELAKISGAVVTTTEDYGKGANYPLKGYRSFYHTNIELPHFNAREVYPWAQGAPGGPVTFKVVEDNLKSRNIDVMLETQALRLISRDAGAAQEVLGVTMRTRDGSIKHVKARHGVILCAGGFEGGREYREQFWEGMPVNPCCGQSNTGDGIRMAQDVGAKIWHMWHFHGCYGFKHPDPGYPYMIRVKRLPDWTPGHEDEAKVKMAWILLDQNARRYMNEYQPYTQDTTHRPLHYFDPATQKYPRNPSFLICDENGRKMYALGRPTSNDKGIRIEWSDDNLREVELGILKKADTLRDLADKLGIDPATAEQSIGRWNEFCAKGSDGDFGRPAGTMAPVDTGPFYGAPVGAIVSNTQGGPVHNANQQIIDQFGDGIARLYAAGEMGSSFGHLYMSGSNITECFVNGRIAGREVMKLKPWDAASAKERKTLHEMEVAK